MKLILVVDMLADFVYPRGALYVKGAENLIHPIKEVLEKGRKEGYGIIYANDSHSANDPEFKTWPKHCVKGDLGSEVTEHLKPKASDIVLEKQDLSVFSNKKALPIFYGAEQVVVVGVATEYCVKQAVMGHLDRNLKPIPSLLALRPQARGDEVIIISDCIAAANVDSPNDGEMALNDMVAAGAVLNTCEQFLGYKLRMVPPGFEGIR